MTYPVDETPPPSNVRCAAKHPRSGVNCQIQGDHPGTPHVGVIYKGRTKEFVEWWEAENGMYERTS